MKIILLLLCSFVTGVLFSQSKNFEGVITYKVEVKSKQGETSDKVMMTILATGHTMTDYIRNGNYHQSSSACETYYIQKDRKIYLKFRSLDTLYFLDYDADTASVVSISRPATKQSIAGYDCNSIVIKTSATTRTYFYAPTLPVTPANNTNEKLTTDEVFVKETKSIWLSCLEDAETYTISHTATKVQPTLIEDKFFELPQLPRKKFELATVLQEPVFSKAGGWNKYLQTAVNPDIAPKYIKIQKGQDIGTQSPVVAFKVSETGQVLDARVMNPKEVHPKIGEEAVRIVMESRGWKPATIYGEKISYWQKQTITFQVSK